jgi:endonuclease/exonuclease/phosphatase (EEP) superfamily protein YafD
VAFDRLDDRVGGSTVVLVHAATAQLMTVSQLAAAPTPAAVLEIRKGGIPVRIIATRLSNPVFQASELWAQGVAALTGELGRSDLQTVVVGDFNATPWHVRYRAFTHDAGLTDCAVPAGATLTGTWRPTRRNWFPLAIDHALARGAKCSSYRVAAVPGSDHKAILVTVALS